MTFEDIPKRLNKLGLDREWLAKESHYSLSSIANMLAKCGNPKSKNQKALLRISEILDREEAKQKNPSKTEEKCAIVVRATPDEFTAWNEASIKQTLTMEEWAIQQLNKAASTRPYIFPQAENLVAEDPTPYNAPRNRI